MKIILYLFFIASIISCRKLVCPAPEISGNKTTLTIPATDTIALDDTTASTDTTQATDTTRNVVNKYTLVLQPGAEGKDALLSSTFPTANFATRSYMHARAWTAGSELNLEKSIIQFDYSAIPAGAVITKATVTFFADTTINTGSIGHSQLSGPNDWTLKRVTQSWDEFMVTWNTQPATDPIHVIQCAASTSASQAYVLDVTSWVIDGIANPTVYYGFLMEINSNEYYRAINFCSSDHIYPSLRPKMVIEYTR